MRAFLLTLAVFAGLIAIVTVRRSRAFRRLAQSRAGQGFSEFAAHFERSEVPEDVQRRVFEYVQENWALGVSGFPVRGDDPIDLYPFDEDDLEEAIIELAKTCGKARPLMNVWNGNPILTVGDLARLIAHLPASDDISVEAARRLWTDR